MTALLGALVGAVVALLGGFAAQQLRDRGAAIVAARLVFFELLSSARQIIRVRVITQHHYAVAHAGIDEQLAQAMEDSGFERIRDESHFMTHLREFVEFLSESGNDEVRQEFAHIVQRRLAARGLSTDEPLRRDAWDTHGAALARIADLEMMASVERAYSAVDKAATVMRESEPTVLTGAFFDVGMRADLFDALRRLARLGQLNAPVIDVELTALTNASQPWPDHAEQ